LRCEVCGRKIFGNSQRVVIEGAKLTVCNECAKHGTSTWEEPKPKILSPKLRAMPQPPRIQIRKPPEPSVDTGVELTENFDVKIRQAREKLGLSHEELGKKMSEKVSLLRKIETGKIKPNNVLATKIEHTLKIKLLVPASKEEMPQAKIPKLASRELTLGDLIQLDKKGGEKEDKPERKSS
jgi:putative transcription factor